LYKIDFSRSGTRQFSIKKNALSLRLKGKINSSHNCGRARRSNSQPRTSASLSLSEARLEGTVIQHG
jgi:hypothetical protein